MRCRAAYESSNLIGVINQCGQKVFRRHRHTIILSYTNLQTGHNIFKITALLRGTLGRDSTLKPTASATATLAAKAFWDT